MGQIFEASELGGLARELAVTIPRRNIRNQAASARQTAHEGMLLTKASAKLTARRHGKKYPGRIRSRRVGPIAWQWGPDVDWSFERGSRNQPPHLNHEHAADRVEGRHPLRAQAAAEDSFVGWQ